jgi:uridine kinase
MLRGRQKGKYMAEIELSNLLDRLKDPTRAILSAESSYHSKINSIADNVSENDSIKIILLAGPSGSGKTTSAALLAESIKAKGRECVVISLDDFYRDSTDPLYPRTESGERDFEAVEALNIPLLEKTLIDVASGRDFEVPRYDFKKACRVEGAKYSKISHGCAIIEGIHALNPRVSEHLPMDRVFRLFISVSTNVNILGERIISGRKLRFIRRMVRDSIYRAADARRTLEMWKNVLIGEDKYLYPYRILADASFDTFHDFEVSVMRPYVERLISPALAEENPYAKTVLSAVGRVPEISESLVPKNSLIREFIKKSD